MVLCARIRGRARGHSARVGVESVCVKLLATFMLLPLVLTLVAFVVAIFIASVLLRLIVLCVTLPWRVGMSQ